MLGAEGEGLRRLTAEKCDRLVTPIPTSDALSAPSTSPHAAAVAAYEWASNARRVEGKRTARLVRAGGWSALTQIRMSAC